MFGHENLNKQMKLNENKIKVPYSDDDLVLKRNAPSLDDLSKGIRQPERSKEQNDGRTDDRQWLKNKLEKLEDDTELLAEQKKLDQAHTEGAHRTQLGNVLADVRNVMAGGSRLVTVPGKTVLLRGLGIGFYDTLNVTERAKKRMQNKTELYQKEKNAAMIELARENYAKKCHAAMTKAMQGREVACANRQDFRDLAQFIGTDEQLFTEADRKKLLDCYIGESLKEGAEGYRGQDRQMALDLMTKAIMAINTDTIRIQSEADVARNADRLEAIAGKVAAFDRMLQQYDQNAEEHHMEKYFAGLDEELRTKVTQKLDSLRLVSYYYVTHRDLIENKYYRTHLNSEMSNLVQDNATQEQKSLAKAIRNVMRAGKKLQGGSDAQGIEIGKETQSQKLQQNLEKMEYFSDQAIEQGYSSKALMSSTTFKGLYLSFDKLAENGRLFGMDSFRMKIVKSHIEEVKRLLERSVSDYDLSAKTALVRAFGQLSRSCRDYCSGGVDMQNLTQRQQSVVDIMNFSEKCLNFVSSIDDEQFDKLTAGNNYKTPLKDIFEKSNLVVDRNEKEYRKSVSESIRMQYHTILPEAFAKNFDRSTSFVYSASQDNIKKLLGSNVKMDEDHFNDIKMEIERQFSLIIRNCKSYTENNTPVYKNGRKKYDTAMEIESYARGMIELVRRIKFADAKKRKDSVLKWEDLIFGDELVVMRKDDDYEDGLPDHTTVFTNTDHDLEKNKMTRAFKFVGGDASMYTEYKPAVYIQKDGTKIGGLAYSSPVNKIKGHSDQIFSYTSASIIKEASREANIKIMYSENALRQLSTMRIMDTLFGKQTRDMDSISYYAVTQMVFGEPRIVVMSVRTYDFNYFKKESSRTSGELKNASVLDENGKLKIGAYDRDLADRIMSLTAQECIAEFGDLAIEMTEDDKAAFTLRFNALKAAFEKDMTEEGGWRHKQDQEDEEQRKEEIKETKLTLKKYRRWGLDDKSNRVKTERKKLRELSRKKSGDSADLYINDLYARIEVNKEDNKQEVKNLGYVDEAFMHESETVDENITLEDELKAQEEQNKNQVLNTGRRKREFAARKKLLQIRETRKKYVSSSDRKRRQAKNELKIKIEKQLNKDIAKKASQAFWDIMDLFDSYLKMDVSCIDCIDKVGEEKEITFHNYAAYRNEGEILKAVVDSAKKRVNEIDPASKIDSEIFEKGVLDKLIKRLGEQMNGKLGIKEGHKHIVYKDKHFCDISVDKVTNEITYNGFTQMFDLKDIPLFTHEPCSSDISQGSVGDCYLLSTMASLVEKNPAFIKEMIKDNGNGTATVRFYDKNGEDLYVTVEKTVPKNLRTNTENRGGYRYAKGALWIQMIEKAFVASGLVVDMNNLDSEKASKKEKDSLAVINTLKEQELVNYENISGANPGNFAYFITGKNARELEFKTVNSFKNQMGGIELVLNKVQKEFLELAKDLGKLNKTYSIVVGSVSSVSGGEDTGHEEVVHAPYQGVFAGHGYTVMGIEVVDGEEMVVLRNPWGYGGSEERYDKESGAVYHSYSRDPKDGGYLLLNKATFFNMFRSAYQVNMK